MNDLFTISRPAATQTVRIEFDGGTSCNVPKLGYGLGYGSYKINNEPVVRCDFGIRMSANAAEVLTLCWALRNVPQPERTHLLICGDSKVALNRAVPILTKRKKAPAETGSNLFRDYCHLLTSLISTFAGAETHWRGRAESVRLFGH